MIGHLPVQAEYGLTHMPAVPIDNTQAAITVAELAARSAQTKPSKNALNNSYTIGGVRATGFEFLYGTAPPDQFVGAAEALAAQISRGATALIQDINSRGQLEGIFDGLFRETKGVSSRPADHPEQYSLSWTNEDNVFRDAQHLLPGFASALTSADAATEAFWPTIANTGVGYNLIILRNVKSAAQAAEFKSVFGDAWTDAVTAMQAAGRLYAIDLRIFNDFLPGAADRLVRFTPGSLVLLEQDAATKAIKPFTVRVSSPEGSAVYSRKSSSEGAWIYALQAARTSVTVYGIWLGHVYHWHMVSAAMQMTLHNNINPGHPLFSLLAPQSRSLIGFDQVLLYQWSLIAPPTSFDSELKFLQLMDRFATGRNYFDDDPGSEIAALGLDVARFTRDKPWDLYPMIGQLLEIWNAVKTYIAAFVDNTYDDVSVGADGPLHAWMQASADPAQGNIRGLPPMNSKDNLKSVLTSLFYRVTAHGISRLNKAINPAISFIPNYPPCLQTTALPKPEEPLDTASLLKMLPWTATIGDQVNFYFIFVFSMPFDNLIPPGGVTSNLPFPGGLTDKRNQAIVKFRETMATFIGAYEPGRTDQIHQWPLSIDT